MNTMHSRRVLVGLVALVAACGSARASSAGDGSAEVIAVTSSALTQADVAGVALTISGDGIAPNITTALAHVGNKFQGIVGGIPAGANRTFHGEGDDANGGMLYNGDATGVTITKGAQALVALILQQQEKPNPFQNSAPQITSVQASSSSVAPADSIGLQATATDPDGDALTYTWSATAGTFTNGASANATWTAPATVGTQTLTLRVRDSKGASAAVSFAVQVSASAGTGSASVAASFNDAPSVTAISIDENPVQVGAIANLGVTATDLDGDAIASYAWSSSCDGGFDDATLAAPKFTLSDATVASCAFTVKVTDARGGYNTGTLSVTTGAATSVASPPIIDSTFQGGDSANGGTSLEFRAKAHDPNDPNGLISYSWSADEGTVGSAPTDANGSDMTWTAPACMTADAHISVVIANATGTSTTQIFTVTPGASAGCTTSAAFERVNLGQGGVQPNDSTTEAAISSDGKFVVFASNATNLGPQTSSNILHQIYRRDRTLGTTSLVSVAADGTSGADGYNQWPSISADGQRIAFASQALNLVPNVGSASKVIYIRDLVSGEMSWIPTSLNTDTPRISADGKHVCFATLTAFVGADTNNSWDVYSWDVDAKTATLVSAIPDALANGSYVGNCSISADGNVVSFETAAGLDPDDTNARNDIYARNIGTGDLSLVSGVNEYGTDDRSAVSADGDHVAFAGYDSLLPEAVGSKPFLFVRTISTGSLWFASAGDLAYGAHPALSADGTTVAFAGRPLDSAYAQIYTSNITTKTPVLITHDGAGSPESAGSSYLPLLTANGRLVFFLSDASDLIANDTNNAEDVFFAAVP